MISSQRRKKRAVNLVKRVRVLIFLRGFENVKIETRSFHYQSQHKIYFILYFVCDFFVAVRLVPLNVGLIPPSPFFSGFYVSSDVNYLGWRVFFSKRENNLHGLMS